MTTGESPTDGWKEIIVSSERTAFCPSWGTLSLVTWCCGGGWVLGGWNKERKRKPLRVTEREFLLLKTDYCLCCF